MEGLGELTNALSSGTIPDPLWPPLPRDWGLQLSYPLLSQDQVKKATDFKFCRNIHRVDRNRSPYVLGIVSVGV